MSGGRTYGRHLVIRSFVFVGLLSEIRVTLISSKARRVLDPLEPSGYYTYREYYFLTPWCRVLLEQLTGL